MKIKNNIFNRSQSSENQAELKTIRQSKTLTLTNTRPGPHVPELNIAEPKDSFSQPSKNNLNLASKAALSQQKIDLSDDAKNSPKEWWTDELKIIANNTPNIGLNLANSQLDNNNILTMLKSVERESDLNNIIITN